MDDEPAWTDARFDRAVLEALHAGETYLPDDAETRPPPALADPTERRVEEHAHEARKWALVARAARSW